MPVPEPSKLPVLVVGAGPSGLVAAFSLHKQGVPVRIIEKRKTYATGFKGSGIQPRSMELYKFLGLEPEILKQATTYGPMRHYDLPPNGKKVLKDIIMAPHLDPTPDCPFLYPLKLDQGNHESILRAQLEKEFIHVELGHALQSLEQSPEHVLARIIHMDASTGEDVMEEAKFAYVVGADGAKGVVRKMIGQSLKGETHAAGAVFGDIRVEEGLDYDYWHSWGDAMHSMVKLCATDHENIFGLIMGDTSVPTEQLPTDKDGIVKMFYEISGRTDVKFGEVLTAAVWKANNRMVDKFQNGKVFLAGDAAHIHSPTGGQGMNSSIQDSINLAWKLALCYHGHASPSLLQTYTGERVPVITQMLGESTKLFSKTFHGESNKEAPDAWKRGGRLLMLGVNYRGSEIVLDERNPDVESKARGGENDYYESRSDGGGVCAGDRAPDASELRVVGGREQRTGVMRLFDVFGYGHHTVLLFDVAEEERKSVAKLLGEYQPKIRTRSVLVSSSDSTSTSESSDVNLVLVDTKSYARTFYSVPSAVEGKGTVFVIRPDGYIGAVVCSGVDGLKRYFDGILVGRA